MGKKVGLGCLSVLFANRDLVLFFSLGKVMVDSKEGTASTRSRRQMRNGFLSCDGCSFFYIIHLLPRLRLLSGRGNCNIISTIFTGVFSFLALFA